MSTSDAQVAAIIDEEEGAKDEEDIEEWPRIDSAGHAPKQAHVLGKRPKAAEGERRPRRKGERQFYQRGRHLLCVARVQAARHILRRGSSRRASTCTCAHTRGRASSGCGSSTLKGRAGSWATRWCISLSRALRTHPLVPELSPPPAARAPGAWEDGARAARAPPLCHPAATVHSPCLHPGPPFARRAHRMRRATSTCGSTARRWLKSAAS